MKCLLDLEVGNEYFVNLKIDEYAANRFIFKLKYIKKYDIVGVVEIYDITENKSIVKYYDLKEEFIYRVLEKIDKKEFRSEKIKELIK